MKRTAAQLIRPEILGMSAYPVADAGDCIKLDAMENPFALPSPLRAELGRRLADVLINRYPDAGGSGLKQALRRQFALPDEAALLLGNGSDEILTLITQALARPGAGVVAFEPSFVMYRLNARFSQLDYHPVDLRADFSLDLDAALAAIDACQPAVVFVSYPNNPTGNRFARAEVETLIDVAPGLVVVDEAYQAYSGDSLMDLAGRAENLMVLRTLSKIGLAGIRLGYAVSTPEWVAQIDKVRPPYNVNVLTQETACFLLEHRALFDQQARLLRQERDRLVQRLAQLPGVTVFPSEANFVTLRVADADALFAYLKQGGILIKNLHGSHRLLENCLRITVGAPEENDAVLAALTAYYG